MKNKRKGVRLVKFCNPHTSTQEVPQDNKKQSNFYQKIFFLTLIFLLGIYIFNMDKFPIKFMADIQGLLGADILVSQADKIKETSPTRPLKDVTSRGKVTEYEKTKRTNFADVDISLKATFPQKLSDIISKYRYIPSAKIYEMISNPSEREQVLFYKRLVTTTWTASYDSTKLWTPDSGTHAGVDFISSIRTPIYSTANGIVLGKSTCEPTECKGFGNYIVIASVLEDQVVAAFYGHMDSIKDGLAEGDIIKKGDLIGYLGDSGNSTAPHLHFQINKLGKLSEVKSINMAKQLFSGRFHDIAGVRGKTVDPIAFIESAGQNLKGDVTNIINTTTIASTETMIETPIIPEKQKFKIKDIKLSTIDTKVNLGDTITATVNTSGETGSISITTNNDVLMPSSYIIKPDGNTTYQISIKANNIGNGEMIFSDGDTKDTRYISVYDKNAQPVGISVDGPDKIYANSDSEFKIYPVDKLGNKVDTYLNGKIDVSLIDQNSQQKYDVASIDYEQDKTVYEFNFTAPKTVGNALTKYKLNVSFVGTNKSYSATKTLSQDIFFDYSIHDEFGQSMKTLNDLGIVQGSKGMLYPNNNISRAELTTIIVRYKYGDKFDSFKSEMNNYIKKNGKFFKDVTGKEWFAPYMYIGFRDGIIKGNKGKGLPNNPVTKAEVVTILGRNFKVWENNQFTSWIDIKVSDWFKSYADAAKKYNLYPFKDLQKFNADQKTTRVFAFESLLRYKTLSPKISVSTPDPETTLIEDINNIVENTGTSSGNTTSGSNLENLVRTVIDF